MFAIFIALGSHSFWQTVAASSSGVVPLHLQCCWAAFGLTSRGGVEVGRGAFSFASSQCRFRVDRPWWGRVGALLCLRPARCSSLLDSGSATLERPPKKGARRPVWNNTKMGETKLVRYFQLQWSRAPSVLTISGGVELWRRFSSYAMVKRHIHADKPWWRRGGAPFLSTCNGLWPHPL